MQIPILKGIFTAGPEFRASYPVNMLAVPGEQGISNGYLRPAWGLVKTADGPDRGGVEWNGEHYRVIGTNLVKVTAGVPAVMGSVGAGGDVRFDYSFDRLAIASGGRLYYWDGALTQVTDADLGNVLDMIWVDGYFMTTDGEYLVVTELADPTSVNPLKYGSSEIDPDPIVAVKKIRGEVYAINRHTIEVFQNIGGSLFPFQRVPGAMIDKGAVSTHACCVMESTLAMVGSGRNESLGVYLALNGGTQKISTQEIDRILNAADPAQISVETMADKSHRFLFVHLADRTLLYDVTASQTVSEHIWVVLTGGLDGFSRWPARHFVRHDGKWWAGGDNLGYLSDELSTQWGNHARWEFGTSIVYNEGRGAIFHDLELVALTGIVSGEPTISTSYSVDGQTWSQERFISAGKHGERAKRLIWLQQGFMRHWRLQRFRGTTQAHISVARLEARIEPMAH